MGWLLRRPPGRVASGFWHDLPPPHPPTHPTHTHPGDASRLLTASVNRTARVLKLPVGRWGGEGTDLLGHGGPLHGADWSREGTLVLTASADRLCACVCGGG